MKQNAPLIAPLLIYSRGEGTGQWFKSEGKLLTQTCFFFWVTGQIWRTITQTFHKVEINNIRIFILSDRQSGEKDGGSFYKIEMKNWENGSRVQYLLPGFVSQTNACVADAANFILMFHEAREELSFLVHSFASFQEENKTFASRNKTAHKFWQHDFTLSSDAGMMQESDI